MNNLKIIVPYRDRAEQLAILQNHLHDLAEREHVNFELIVVEQNDTLIFRRGSLRNFGVSYLINKYPDLDPQTKIAIHDVDYLPTTFRDYFISESVVLPVKTVKFLNEYLTYKNTDVVPSGYQHFNKQVDDNFFGGVSVFTLDAYVKCNGFNPHYIGWGLEDDDLRERVHDAGFKVVRGTTEFHALNHKDSFPGLNDPNFVNNQKLYQRRKVFYRHGMNMMRYDIDKIKPLPHGEKLMVSNLTFDAQPNVDSVKSVEGLYADVPDVHVFMWREFESSVNADPLLKSHRDFIERNNFGYGDRPFHWMWNLLIRDIPNDFKFLEIGVFKGQVISLVSLLNRELQKNGTVYGITPLSSAGDKYGTHPNEDYELAIQQLYGALKLTAEDLNIIQGFSNNVDIINLASELGLYDIVYVDGCHDYDVVVSDLTEYREMVKINGYLVIDDASNSLQIPDGLIRMDWRGLPEVSKALADVIEPDERFQHVFAIGHNRVFRRIA